MFIWEQNQIQYAGCQLNAPDRFFPITHMQPAKLYMKIRSYTFDTFKSSPYLPSLETSIVKNLGPETKTLVSFLNLKVGNCYICGFAAFVLRMLGFGLLTTLTKAFSMVLASLQ